MVPPEVMTPTQTARYSAETDRAMSSRVSAVCASGVRATIRRPLVSLSSRWMMPARGIEARRGSQPNNAFCSVCRGFPAPGCTTSPTGLSTTSTSGSSCTILSGIASGKTAADAASDSPDMRTCTRDPALTTSLGLQGSLPICTRPASIHPLIRVRECSGSIRASALSRRNPFNSSGICSSMARNSALMGALEASGGASGILPRFGIDPHCKESHVRLRDLVQPSRAIVLIVGMGLLAAGCRSHRVDDAKSGPEVLYARAQKSMRDSSYGQAVKQLENLQSRFPFSEPARQAQIDLIYAYYKNREVDPAVDAADTFIRENPTNPRVDYAYYMKGLIYFERQANFMERWFHVDLSRRPPVNSRKAFDAFDDLIKKYPHSQYVGDARQRIVFLRNRLADFELYVASYYMRRGAYVGALNRAKFCIENYDGAPAVQGSMKVLVQAYTALGMTDLAKNAETVYVDNYPGSARDVEKKKAWWRRIL